jgi:hypothetical protein
MTETTFAQWLTHGKSFDLEFEIDDLKKSETWVKVVAYDPRNDQLGTTSRKIDFSKLR